MNFAKQNRDDITCKKKVGARAVTDAPSPSPRANTLGIMFQAQKTQQPDQSDHHSCENETEKAAAAKAAAANAVSADDAGTEIRAKEEESTAMAAGVTTLEVPTEPAETVNGPTLIDSQDSGPGDGEEKLKRGIEQLMDMEMDEVTMDGAGGSDINDSKSNSKSVEQRAVDAGHATTTVADAADSSARTDSAGEMPKPAVESSAVSAVAEHVVPAPDPEPSQELSPAPPAPTPAPDSNSKPCVDRKVVKSLSDVYRFWEDAVHELGRDDDSGLQEVVDALSGDTLSTAFSGALPDIYLGSI